MMSREDEEEWEMDEWVVGGWMTREKVEHQRHNLCAFVSLAVEVEEE